MVQEYLFAYGTLRRKAGLPRHRILAEGGRFVSEATFQGKLYDVGAYPGVIPSADDADRVTGEVYALARPDTLFQQLDAYEGGEYRRERHSIRLADGDSIDAWIYIFVVPTDGVRFIPSGDYLSPDE